ncbi:hypothetical protein J6590_035791 [Homalodisca vitripennis]|nr:hypothetical protein J6590_035791 [Homalodisca vitripennis]
MSSGKLINVGTVTKLGADLCTNITTRNFVLPLVDSRALHRASWQRCAHHSSVSLVAASVLQAPLIGLLQLAASLIENVQQLIKAFDILTGENAELNSKNVQMTFELSILLARFENFLKDKKDELSESLQCQDTVFEEKDAISPGISGLIRHHLVPIAERSKSLDFESELGIARVRILSVTVALFNQYQRPCTVPTLILLDEILAQASRP